LVSAFRSELLPTFDRPANAISGTSALGQELELRGRLQELDGPEKSFRASSARSAYGSGSI
jgi:hypothetical protein